MLRSTFQHLKGIGAKSERAFWKKGITNWDEYIYSCTKQPSLFSNIPICHSLTESITAYQTGDLNYFAKSLQTGNYYRALLDFPQDVLFIDIETTGLSVYYHQVTIVGWSIGNKYGVYINGGDEFAFRDALNKAKAIVTFNGIMFDLRFIEKHFDNLKIPLLHLDLRYFTRRVGLSGGQKSIEQQIGFKRKSEIDGMLGEAAPILWHKYRRGDNEALKRLIEYNHADIEGMKFILDRAIELYQEKEKIPKKIAVKPKFKELESKIKWVKNKQKNINSNAIYVPPFQGSTEPLITYDDLDSIHPLNQFCCVGIDLVASDEKESGFCILRGRVATTSRIKTDEQMVRLAIEAGADLVSIDSPLSIPMGRKSFFDNSPCRAEFGIIRECERVMHRRGIKSYPCLIKCMQKLTQRGMLLADKFRKAGLPVIESYPGAAQDIMQIPRKQAGENFLVDGLKEFGLTGEFIGKEISHDELDAITSAIVGQFFWVGMFEGLGNYDEEYLIIPDLRADFKSWLSRKIIGLSGQIATGKTTVAEYLSKKGYVSSRYSQVLKNILSKEGKESSRSSLQKIGWKVHKEKGQRWLGKKVCELIDNQKCCVVDGMRFLEDHALMVEMYGPTFHHIHLTSPFPERKRRVESREKEDITLDSATHEPVEKEIDQLAQVAGHVIKNDGTIEDLLNHSVLRELLREKCQ